MKKKLKEIADIKFCLANKETIDREVNALTPLNLLENNVIKDIILENKIKADDTTRILNEDIVIKRINPLFVNYIDNIDNEVYAAGNLIIVRSSVVYPKYLAYILNDLIKKITQSSVGVKIPAIGRVDLEEIQVPIISQTKQVAIGELWYKGLELYKLNAKLNDLQKLKMNTILTKTLHGGK